MRGRFEDCKTLKARVRLLRDITVGGDSSRLVALAEVDQYQRNRAENGGLLSREGDQVSQASRLLGRPTAVRTGL